MTLTMRTRRQSNRIDEFEAFLDSARPALDLLRANVMMADRQLRLAYANPAALETLRNVEPEVRQAFGLGVGDMLGGSIHRFHRDPARVERILAEQEGFRFPHKAEMSFGRVSLRTTINVVRDSEGAAMGYIVNWDDVSEVKRGEVAIDHLRQHLESAATATEEMTAAVGMIAQNAADAASVAHQAVGVVDATRQSMAILAEESGRIHQELSAITGVAEQTKMLALNATIESARAGEAGKGFAVVASEVKQLADDTARVTAGIGKRISAMAHQVTEVSESITEIFAVIDQVNEHQTSIAGAVEEQSAVTAEIAARIAGAAEDSMSISLG